MRFDYQLYGRLPSKGRDAVLQAINKIRIIELDYLDKELTPEETVKLRDLVAEIYVARWDRDSMLKRRDRFYDEGRWVWFWSSIGVVALIVMVIFFVLARSEKPVSA